MGVDKSFLIKQDVYCFVLHCEIVYMLSLSVGEFKHICSGSGNAYLFKVSLRKYWLAMYIC